MKKYLALLLALCMIFALAACGESAAPAATAVAVEGTKLVEGLNLIDNKAVVVAKEGKATLVYVEEGFEVTLGEEVLVLGEAVAYAADDLASVAEAPAATANK